MLLLLAPVSALAAEMGIEIDLNWQPPTENVDGTPLTDLASFNFYVGSRAQSSDLGIINLPDPFATSTTIALDVESGTSVFVRMTALDAEGNESEFSNEVMKGPAFASDDIAPSSVNGLGAGSIRVVRCPSGFSCSVSGQ